MQCTARPAGSAAQRSIRVQAHSAPFAGGKVDRGDRPHIAQAHLAGPDDLAVIPDGVREMVKLACELPVRIAGCQIARLPSLAAFHLERLT